MIKRFIESHLRRLAGQYSVVTMTGPRQSGKTTLCRALFPTHAYVNLEDLDTRSFAGEDPRGFLAQYTQGVILDEIQRVPQLPSYIQGIVDAAKKPGMFILTGSQQFEINHSISQSLAGRTAILKLLPFAYGELYASNSTHPAVDKILHTGFYPRIHDQNLNPTEALSFYVSTYVERDLQSLLRVKDLSDFGKFLKLCASNIGQLVNWTQLGNDCGIDQKTVKAWLSILEQSYIVFLLRPHSQNFRKRLVKSPKLYFYDVGLASYLLGITKPENIFSHPLRGFLFENFIVAEFLKHRWNKVTPNNLYFFRDHVGNEVDLILDQGSELVSVEIKSGKTIATDFFKGLGYYAGLAKSKNKKRFLIYGGDETQNRSDGTAVSPYFCLEDVFASL